MREPCKLLDKEIKNEQDKTILFGLGVNVYYRRV
jgi:hypothetical protein